MLFPMSIRKGNGGHWLLGLLLALASACSDETRDTPAPWKCRLASSKTDICSCAPGELEPLTRPIGDSCAESVSSDFLCCAYGVNGNMCDCYYSTGHDLTDNGHCGPEVEKVPSCP